MSINLLISKRDELAAQLAAHEAMLADARKAERAEAIEKLKAMMAEHGITAADLDNKPGMVRLAMRHTSKSSVRTAKPAPGVRYVFGETSYTTGQRGKPPRSYSEAKRAGTLEAYRVAEVA